MTGLFIAAWILSGIFSFICTTCFILYESKVITLGDLMFAIIVGFCGIISASLIVLLALIIILTALPERYPILDVDLKKPINFIVQKLNNIVIIDRTKRG